MPYVLRDRNGSITELFGEPDPTRGVTEQLPSDNPEVIRFLGGTGGAGGASIAEEAVQQLAVSDGDMARVTEDLITVLIDKGVLLFTDLPPAARRKLLSRRQLREQLGPFTGMINPDEEDIL